MQSDVVQELFHECLQYGFHEVFIMAAFLEPALYPYVHTITMDERIQAEGLVIKLFPS